MDYEDNIKVEVEDTRTALFPGDSSKNEELINGYASLMQMIKSDREGGSHDVYLRNPINDISSPKMFDARYQSSNIPSSANDSKLDPDKTILQTYGLKDY